MVRIFKIAAGVILILTGVFCFASPGATFLSVAFPLGFAMLLSGISETLAYLWISRKEEISASLMIEGVTGILLGGLVLANQLQADATIPVFFGLWVMFAGIIRAVEGYTRRKSGRSQMVWLLAMGILGIVVGLYAFFNTVLFAFSPVLLAGILFVVQGFNILLVGVHLSFRHKRKQEQAG